MKKGFLVLALIGLIFGVDAQDTLRTDSLLKARQSEAEAFVQKSDLYHAAFDYQLLLDESLRGRRKTYVLNAYNALIHISEKCFNYPKAFLYQSAYFAFRDSLLKEQNSRALLSQEAAFKQYESDFNKALEIEKARAAKYEDLLLHSHEDQKTMHTLVYMLIGSCVLLSLLLVFCIIRLRRGRRMPAAAQASVTKPVPAQPLTVQKAVPKSGSPEEEKQASLIRVSDLKEIADVTSRFRLNKLEAIFESVHAPELFTHATQASPADPLVLLLLASAGMEERQSLLSLTDRAAALSKSQTPDQVLAEVIGDKLNRSAIYAVFDLKGGWLRFACTQASLWLIRKGEFKEFGAFMPADSAAGRSTIPVQTLGLRKGDWLFMVLIGNADSENFGKQAGVGEISERLLKSIAAESALVTKEVRATLVQAVQTYPGISVLGVCI
jgi:hypothetical protein